MDSHADASEMGDGDKLKGIGILSGGKLEDTLLDTDDPDYPKELTNGHNFEEAVDILPRTKTISELLQESENLNTGLTESFVTDDTTEPPPQPDKIEDEVEVPETSEPAPETNERGSDPVVVEAKAEVESITEEKSDATHDAPIESCTCEPSCHSRMLVINEHLSAATSELEVRIQEKSGGDLRGLLGLLVNIKSLAANQVNSLGSPQAHLFSQATGSKLKLPRKSADRKSQKTEKKPRESKKSVESREVISPTFNFDEINGLAVFAKWPTIGNWFYPGIVEGITSSDWKEKGDVIVHFYDGLVRSMKNIYILPAALIPPGVTMCNLDDESEMVVASSQSSSPNQINFNLKPKGASDEVELPFNKLAIKSIHMKVIKQSLDPNVDVPPKKMHLVSLDNLVSGRRTRVQMNKEETESPLKTTRKRRRSVQESVGSDGAEAEVTIPKRKYARKNGSASLSEKRDDRTRKSDTRATPTSSKNRKSSSKDVE